MKDELHRYLDGEESLEPNSYEAPGKIDAWERLLEAFRSAGPTPAAPPWLETRVMAEIETLPEPGLLRRFSSWMVQPREVRISPLVGGLVAAVLSTLLLVEWPGSEVPAVGSEGVEEMASNTAISAAQVDVTVYVQFALEAPGASSVSVGGDFDGWTGSHSLTDVDGDGIWTGRVPVRPGLHAYMFLVDGSSWVTDPRAERYSEDGFGNRNALLAVAAPSA
jgi:hypothetical protein